MSGRPPRLIVAGSIALDTLSGPYGEVEGELGGSALYFAVASALARDGNPVEVVAPVGADAVAAVQALLAGRPIEGGQIALVDAPTYRWRAVATAGGNRDLGSRDSVYDRWSPEVPDAAGAWIFTGSMRTDRQVDALNGARGAQLVALDAMRSYIGADPRRFLRALGLAGWFFATDDELGALGDNDPDRFRRDHNLVGLVIKHGAAGVTAWTAEGGIRVTPPAGLAVVDTTGAGDALAGGFLGAWSLSGGNPGALGDALRMGVAAASITIEDVGLRALRRATPDTLKGRLAEVPLAARTLNSVEFESGGT